MIILSMQHGYKIINSGDNFWIEDKFGDVHAMTKTKRTIKNRMKKICQCLNKNFIDF